PRRSTPRPAWAFSAAIDWGDAISGDLAGTSALKFMEFVYAGSRSRQQCRPGAPRLEEETAARGRVAGIEVEAPLRKTVGKGHTQKGRGDPPRAQNGAQASNPRRPHSGTEEEVASDEGGGHYARLRACQLSDRIRSLSNACRQVDFDDPLAS